MEWSHFADAPTDPWGGLPDASERLVRAEAVTDKHAFLSLSSRHRSMDAVIVRLAYSSFGSGALYAESNAYFVFRTNARPWSRGPIR